MKFHLKTITEHKITPSFTEAAEVSKQFLTDKIVPDGIKIIDIISFIFSHLDQG